MNGKKSFKDILNEGEVSASQKWWFGIAAMLEFFLGNLIGGSMIVFYTDHIGLASELTYGNAFIIFAIWNMINDPIFAYISDKRKPHPKYGKRKPFIILGPLIFMVGFILLILCPRGFNDSLKFVWILTSFFIYDLGLAMFAVNISALMITITKDPNERAIMSLLKSYIILVPGGVAGLFPAYIFTSGFSYEQIITTFILIACILFVTSFIAILKLKEPIELYIKVTPIQKNGSPLNEIAIAENNSDTVQTTNPSPSSDDQFDMVEYGFMKAIRETFKSESFRKFALYMFFGAMMVASYYEQLIYLMNWVYDVSGIYAVIIAAAGGATINIFYLGVNQLRKRIGIMKTLTSTFAIAAIGYIIIFFMDTFWYLLIGYVLGCIGFSAFWFMNNIMIGDIADEEYVKTGKNRQAMFGSVSSLVSVPAQAILVYFFTLSLDLSGYEGTAEVQTDGAIFGIRFAVALLRVIMICITIIVLQFYPLKGQRYQKLREDVAKIEAIRSQKFEELKKEIVDL